MPRTLFAACWRAVRLVGRHDLIEFIFVGLAFFLYFLVRTSVVQRTTEAFERALAIIRLEQTLGLFWELQLQTWALSSHLLIRLWNDIYFWGHFPVIIAIGVFLYICQRHHYVLLRNALLLSGALALVFYYALPVAPPRFLPQWGFVDTMALYSQMSYQAQEVGFFVNPYAAVPSLHFGWVFILGIALIWFFRRNPIVWVLGITMPALQLVAIVVTGNHFILDAIVGGLVSVAGLMLALALRRWGYGILRRYLPESVVQHLTPPPGLRGRGPVPMTRSSS